MSDQTEPLILLDADGDGEPTLWSVTDDEWTPIISRYQLRGKARHMWPVIVSRVTVSAEARVRELEAALQQSRDDHQGAVEKLRAEVDGVAASLSERDRALTACNNDFGRALELLRAAERDRDAAQEKLRAVEALADEWDGAADHGEDERYGRIIARTLRGCADDLRKRLGPRPCPKCGGAASWHGDEWSCYGECTGYGRLASPVESDADAEGAS
jgi:hypothetical protein